jgi:membrane-bound serine protease (ClpP class)
MSLSRTPAPASIGRRPRRIAQSLARPRRTERRAVSLLAGLLAVLAAGALALPGSAPDAQAQVLDVGPGDVWILTVDGEIDLGLAALTERVLREAVEADVALIVVRIDTPGGRLDAVLRMRDALLGSRVPTLAFVDRDAFSAGALVAIAAESLWVAPGAVIGAATPVLGDGQTADEKTISAVRAVFRATAIERDRDPAVAEAMVDPALVVEGLVRRGELLTLDVSQAQAVGYADGVAADLPALIDALGLSDRTQVAQLPALAERLVRILTGGIVAGLLLTVGIWLLVGDVLGGGGLGLGAALGATAIATFLFGHQLAGLAGWESVVLIILGIVLIAVEVLVLPGVGIAGVSGVVALLGGAVMAMVDREVDVVSRGLVLRAFSTAGIAFIAAVVLIVVALSVLGRTGSAQQATPALRASRLVLTSDVGGGSAAELLGATGVTLTDLHPAGAAEIDGLRIDVVAEAGYLPAGTNIVIVSDEGYRRVVRAR